MKVLIRFCHGLGDCVQLTVILKHLRKHKPDWTVDVRLGRGKHTAIIGLCRRVYHDEEPEPPGPYDQHFDISFWENFNCYTDRPCTKVTNCLQEVFGLNWDESLGRYEILITEEAKLWAATYYASIGATETNGKFNVVILHAQGNTSPHKKNIAHWQAKEIAEAIIHAGRVPVIFDWDGRSPLPNDKTIFCPGAGYKIGNHPLWGENWGSGDAVVIAALQSLAEAFIGVDSGPAHVASSTETPALVLWKEHHPIQFHDPAANTVHLVPSHHRSITPAGNNSLIADWFEAHYRFRTYADEQDLTAQAQAWLNETLGCKETARVSQDVKYVLPNGIGDVVWALMKIRAIANGDPIDIILSGNPGNEVDHRSVPFLKRFPFIREIEVLDVPVLVDRYYPNDEQGRYRYKPDGRNGNRHYLVPNTPLEHGIRLEDWLPKYPINWNILDEFDWSNTERGSQIGHALTPFVAFYLGPERGNVDEGHNRGFQWEPKHWIELGGAIRDKGYNIAAVGAHYDRSYWERYVRPGVDNDSQNWIDLLGKLEIGETLALLRRASLVVSYQCGLGICAHYLGVPVIMWWRADGDSAHPERNVSFHEDMRHCWTNPAYKDRYYGAIYKRESVADLLAVIDERGWLVER